MPGGALSSFIYFIALGVDGLFHMEGKCQMERNQRLVSNFGSGVYDLAGCISVRVYGWRAIKKEDIHGKKIS